MTWPEMDFCEGDKMPRLGTSCVDTFGFQPDRVDALDFWLAYGIVQRLMTNGNNIAATMHQ